MRVGGDNRMKQSIDSGEGSYIGAYIVGYPGGYCTVPVGTAAVPALWVLQMGTVGYCGHCGYCAVTTVPVGTVFCGYCEYCTG
jgi:hypothetical protein